MTFRKILWVSLVCMVTSGIKGQAISSPYSINGIGEIFFQGLPNNYSMGEIGIGAPTPWHINLQNPSNLIYNNFSSFQVGVNGDYRSYTSDTDTYSEATASLRFLAMSFPLKKGRWITSLSLTPLSTVNYNTYSRDSIGTTTRLTQNQGQGGLTQLSWGHGIRIYKSLALGFKASYVFGEITRDSRDQLSGEDIVSGYAISYKENTSYSDFIFSAALSYRWRLAERNFINFGATYDLSRELDGSLDRYFERLNLNGAVIQQSTLAEGESVSFALPKAYGIGFSYEKLNQFQVGVDMKLREWESSNSETSVKNLRNTMDIAFGGSWTPDYQSVNKYLDRATYRLGFNLKQLPYLVNNTEINDFGINFGASFPVSGFSSLDAAFKYGFRGTTQNNLIRENYFQIVIGATINDNHWFEKRRYD